MIEILRKIVDELFLLNGPCEKVIISPDDYKKLHKIICDLAIKNQNIQKKSALLSTLDTDTQAIKACDLLIELAESSDKELEKIYKKNCENTQRIVKEYHQK